MAATVSAWRDLSDNCVFSVPKLEWFLTRLECRVICSKGYKGGNDVPYLGFSDRALNQRVERTAFMRGVVTVVLRTLKFMGQV
jgi:hypothetical protein